jgi:hypothetical protein
MMTHISTIFLAAALGLGACAGGEPAATPAPTDAPKPGDEAPPAFDPGASAENIALVPSPVETERALEAAGIDTKLATLIPERKLDMNVSDLDQVAVRTGVVLADMLLTVKTADKEQLLEYVGRIRIGMKQLQGGKDIDATLQDMTERIKADSVTRDELLREFDELSGAVIPELEFNNNQRVVPLIEAGSWVEGANLVSRAIKNKGSASTADQLLKQPAVVEYFIEYVQSQGDDVAPEAMTKQLSESLTTLKGLAEKTEQLSLEDIDTIISVTDSVLTLL